MTSPLESMRSVIERTETIPDSVAMLISGIAQHLRESASAMNTLAAQLDAQKDTIVGWIVANTEPPTPPPAPEPEPQPETEATPHDGTAPQ